MIKKISIRLRLTLLSALLLSVCCIGLTIVLNFSVFNLVDTIDATLINTPATEVSPSISNNPIDSEVSIPTENIQTAKNIFSLQSIIYMLIAIIGGSALTYYVSGKALKPLDALTNQVKNLNANNLSESLIVPPTNDEIADLTTSFNDMTDKLNSVFISQKTFSANAAHELRTPLAILQTKLDVFKKKPVHSDQEYMLILSVFEKQITRLRYLVNQLLDMNNLDNEFEKSNVCLKDIFEDIISELNVITKDKNITLSLDCDDSTLFGNIDLLYRAFYNIIENGIKYNVNNGFVQIIVTKKSNNEIQILIKDGGIGISSAMKSHIFEPFYRVDKSRSRDIGGVGLGLSIVDSIVKKHNGKITVLDNDNCGTCFQFIFTNQ